jgi:hypothetical protein
VPRIVAGGEGISMNFGQAIKSGFSNYVNFSGRAIRSEYWLWTLLFLSIGELVAAAADRVAGLPMTAPPLVSRRCCQALP